MNNQQSLSKSWFFLLSLIVAIGGGAAALVAAVLIKQAQSDGHTLSMTDGKHIQLTLGIIVSIIGSFGLLFVYIRKNGYCSTCLGQCGIHEPSMADRLREEKRRIDISMATSHLNQCFIEIHRTNLRIRTLDTLLLVSPVPTPTILSIKNPRGGFCF